ncbi:DUF1501 domain-containing protein [Paracidovorax valerianellae]|uniref:Uncharacterized conserved protein, DUF1501 family n=1 Tax=Paracidovorax valerianellae TaxID=187868 RepID=A0A1G6JVC8_9BURK|nr:DUF1501 domain-containing protein [Paracidovorax valerianellae]MDA8445255.1 DUF1501 domain-containing protein [Paracidovorax valerianellae]SDC22700.1 Uncharacterized conserved protein, DUF1501 family [Paracidovorax valerianellae]
MTHFFTPRRSGTSAGAADNGPAPTRRQCLQALAALATPGVLQASLAATPQGATDARFLLVFLRGGYDCASLLVPTASDYYYETRPNIAIAKPGEASGALPLTADWGLHPALAGSLLPLYQKKQVAFVPFSGTEDLTRSHFDTQDSIELGQPVGGRRDYRSGFLNRLAAELGVQPRWHDHLSPMAFTDTLPLVLRGGYDVPNTALGAAGAAKPGIDDRQAGLIASMYGGTPLAAAVAEGFQTRDEVARTMQGEMDAASRNALSTKGFEGTARRMARLMQSRYNLGFVDVGGWDTHVGQGNATGALANRFEELGRGLSAFADEMGPAWNKTTAVVISEFGRTFRENGNRGTDHGHGSVMWVLGGGVSGGRIAGEQQALTATTLFQNRDYPVLNDYRAVLGGLFARMYGLNGASLARVFPGTKAKDVRLV